MNIPYHLASVEMIDKAKREKVYRSPYPNRRQRRSMYKQDTLEKILSNVNIKCKELKEKIDEKLYTVNEFYTYKALSSYKNKLINIIKNGGKDIKGNKIKFT